TPKASSSSTRCAYASPPVAIPSNAGALLIARSRAASAEKLCVSALRRLHAHRLRVCFRVKSGQTQVRSRRRLAPGVHDDDDRDIITPKASFMVRECVEHGKFCRGFG